MSEALHATDLGSLLQGYFYSYLINQRRMSTHTVAAYRDTFRLLLPFMAKLQRKTISSLALIDLNADCIIEFLNYLECERGNSVRTRNARLAVLRSFLNFAAIESPAALPDIQRALAIPQKRYNRRMIECLDKDEVSALLNAPDPDTWSGHRDRILLLALYNTGARVSEIIRVQRQDVDLQRQHAVHIHGKGRKERIIPLWPHTVRELRRWIKNLDPAPNSPVFTNRFGEPLSRSGVRQRLCCAQRVAAKTYPSLKSRKISPHTLRHATALHLLQSGVELTVIALWLGHEQIDTTHQYMEADLDMKKSALNTLKPINVGASRTYHKPSEAVLTFLESL